jgi:tRNA pseudouridine38-40 synthase
MQTYFYLIHFQFLGFRYHGWSKQPDLLTLEQMMEKTLGCVLGHGRFKILVASRTDAKVSAHHCAFELFVKDSLDPKKLLVDLNLNLPGDIRILGIEETDKTFNIINSPKTKEYHYLFSFGEKGHPFCAPLMSCFPDDLDIELMQSGARLFKGTHHFIRYSTKPGPDATFERDILESRITKNTLYTANFFPHESYMYIIRSKGFLRYQVRLIMGQLLSLGRGEISLEDIRESLTGNDPRPLRHIAPASGLILNEIIFKT